jgi:hypothetical protein
MIWNLINSNWIKIPDISYRHIIPIIGLPEIVPKCAFPCHTFANKISVRVYKNKSVIKVSDNIINYFAPNTNITFVNFSPKEWNKDVYEHEINNKGQFIVNFAYSGLEEPVCAKIVPCKLVENNEEAFSILQNKYSKSNKYK